MVRVRLYPKRSYHMKISSYLPPSLGSTARTTHPVITTRTLLILTIAVLPLTPARRLEVVKTPSSIESVSTTFLLQEVKIFGEDELQLQYTIAGYISSR